MKKHASSSPSAATPTRRPAVAALFATTILAAAAALHLPAASAEFEEAAEFGGAAGPGGVLNLGTAGTDASVPAFRLEHDGLTGEARLVAYDPLAAWLWAADNGFTRQMLLSETGTLTVYAPDGKTLTLNPAAGTITASDGAATVQIAGGPAGAATVPVVNFGNGARLAATGQGALAVTSSDALVATLNSGGIVVRGGTAAAPGLRFAGDAATGIFATAAGVLGFSTNGTERLRVDAGGNISIGAPAADATADERLVVLGNISLPTPGTGIKFADGTVLTSALASGLVVSGGGAAAALPAPASLTDAKLDGTTALANATVQTMTAKNIATFDGYTNFNSGVTFTNGLNVAKGDTKLMGNYLMMGSYYYECENEGAFAIIYEDDPEPDQLIFRTAPMIDWFWQEGNSTTLRTQMKLDTNGNLTVYDASATSNQRSLTLVPGNSTTPGKIVAYNGTGNVDLITSSNTGALLVNAGNATAPVFGFASDPNTGIFNAAADTLGFSTGGTERVRITSAGFLGVNATAPIGKLQINSLWTNNPAGNGTVIYTSNSGFSANNTTAEVIVTTSLSATTPGASIGLALHNNNTTAGAYAPLLVFSKRESGATTNYNSSLAAIGARAVTGNGTGTDWIDGDLMFYTSPSAGTGLVERVRIEESGDVGIGTSSPDARLAVNGTVKFSNAAGNATTLEIDSGGNVTIPHRQGDIVMGDFGLNGD